MSRLAVWLLVAGVLVGASAALWLAGEMHERNCLQKVTISLQDDSFGSSVGRSYFGVSTGHCSRLPF